MLAVAIGKIIKNKWLFLCLFIACVFSVALIASMPVYENAINNRMLQRELREWQSERNRPPLIHNVAYQGSVIALYAERSTAALDSFVQSAIIPRFSLPVAERRLTLSRPAVSLLHISPYNEMSAPIGRSSMVYTKGLFDRVELVAGHFPNESDDSGTVEVVVSEAAANVMPFMLGSEYILDFSRMTDWVSVPDGFVRLRVVGIIRETDPNDIFWQIRPLTARNVYTTYEAFTRIFQVGALSDFSAVWETVFDHTALEPENIQYIFEILQERGTGTLSNQPILRRAAAREAELGPFLRVLQIPILALLVFFIIMLSGLILDHDKIEIALLYSRGAGKGRILAMYTIQAFLLAGLGIAAGIPLSLVLCMVIGSAAGFLEFAGRAPLDVTVTAAVFRYALAGAGLFIASILLPIIFSGSTSIVAERRQKAARGGKPFFEKYCLDLILVGISIYGYFSYQNLTELLAETDTAMAHYSIDPLIFLIATFFFVGFAMLFTRIYPYIIRLLFSAGRSVWPPAVYASLSAARSRPRSRYIMLFIIMTSAISLFAAAAARTINQNNFDRTMYDIGADLVIQERWPFVDPEPAFCPETGLPLIPPVQYLLFTEPPFERLNEAEGVALATKVYRNDRAEVRTLMRAATPLREAGRATRISNVNIMAIYPDEFAQVAWWRGDMFDYHFNHKMNAMSVNPNVVLLSRNLMNRLAVIHGDEIRVTWANNTHEAVLYVYDGVDFFPTFYNIAPNGSQEYLIVMNYELVSAEFRIEPYEVWIMKEYGASAADILRYYIDNDILLTSIKDAQTRLAAARNEPLILSMNGFLTLSFVITLTITIAGFLVFWSFELRSRRLQISIMRSTGMSGKDVAIMLLWEQILLSLLPLIAGFVLGEVGSSLFVPMFEMRGDESLLPFKVFRQAEDSLRVAVIISGSIAAASAMLWYMAARINIAQTLKLGEE